FPSRGDVKNISLRYAEFSTLITLYDGGVCLAAGLSSPFRLSVKMRQFQDPSAADVRRKLHTKVARTFWDSAKDMPAASSDEESSPPSPTGVSPSPPPAATIKTESQPPPQKEEFDAKRWMENMNREFEKIPYDNLPFAANFIRNVLGRMETAYMRPMSDSNVMVESYYAMNDPLRAAYSLAYQMAPHPYVYPMTIHPAMSQLPPGMSHHHTLSNSQSIPPHIMTQPNGHLPHSKSAQTATTSNVTTTNGANSDKPSIATPSYSIATPSLYMNQNQRHR
ncbi:hypothetical protein PROFUN_10637, partial [Planoprotostelium fungivorum]